jgi:GT2 family glycosyltransferase
MNLSRREFYEDIGLQDENLFMYSDEVDIGLRAMKSKFEILTTRQAIIWHEHINPKNDNIRLGHTQFLIRRNKIYLGYKHFGFVKALNIFLYQLIIFPIALINYIKTKNIKLSIYYLLGCLFGLLKLMKNYKFIINNKI